MLLLMVFGMLTHLLSPAALSLTEYATVLNLCLTAVGAWLILQYQLIYASSGPQRVICSVRTTNSWQELAVTSVLLAVM